LAIHPSTRPQIAKLIKSTKWAEAFTAKEVATLSGYVQVCVAEKDAFIVREGGREAYMCLLIKGLVSIVKEDKRIGAAGPGRIVGEMSLIDGQPRSASIVVVEPTTMVVLTAEDFARLSEEVPHLATKVLHEIARLLSERLRQTSAALVDYIGGLLLE
jgi:CRP-like cAMP-binding protein